MSTVQIRLLRIVLKEAFGEIIEVVGHTLATKGALPLPILVQTTKLPSKVVKEALLVLIHHNLVRYNDASEDEDEPNRPTLYRIDVENVLLRLSFPLFTSLAEQRQPAGYKLMLEIIKHGRLAKDSIPEGCEEACTRMVDEGFLQVVTPECSRYYMTDVVGTVNVHAATQSPSSKKRTLNSPTKAKKPKVESPSSSIPAVYYRLNTRTFITALWQQQLTEITRRRINEAASAVMHAAFTCLGLRAATGGLTFNAFQVSTKLPSGTPLLVDNNSRTMGEHSPLTQYLDCLAQELDFIKKLDTRTGGTYSIDERASIHYCRMRTIESFIATRFGAASVRILRILQDKKMLEEKTISKIAMITAKETRERLYQMLAVGLVHLQEVPKTLDHAPSRTFFLWTIPIPLIFTRISEMALRSVGNLLIRAEAEYQRQHLLVVKSERSDVAANPSLLSETEQRQLNTLKKTLDRLHVSCCRIISEYLILQHY